MARLTLNLLGLYEIRHGSAPVTLFGSDKARALLAYLAVESARPHRREELVGLLWPDCPEETARHNLRQALFNIRRAIGDASAHPPYLLINRQEIHFNRSSDHVLDVSTFNAHVASCETHGHRELESCGECAARLQQAVGVYRGRFLEHFFLEDSAGFEEWALVQRENLHRRALEALAHLGNYHERLGDYEPARRYAVHQLELDPWREEAHRQLMRALAQSGERAAALAQYETCRRVLAEELGVEPAAETRELHAQISRGEFTARPAATAAPHSIPANPLPVPLTPFVGRERELADLHRLLADPQCRLITLIGVGGIGKTRLALQAAAEHRQAFADGVVFVPLASVASAGSIVPAIAEALGLVFPGSRDPQVQLLQSLRDRQMLLVLDNLEHLLEATGLFVEILQHAPGVKLLCTSRQSLALQSEWLFEVEGLAVPPNEHVENFEEHSAVALFLQRARRARVGFALTAEERPGVARICRLVEGMPLGLELAATWVRTLSTAEIAGQIEQNVDFLTGSLRDLPERHRGVRAVFEQSWRMLTPEEQRVLSRLAVFRGGFKRHAADRVAGASLSVLASLVTRSLVRRVESDRYDLHELVRQYAAARLATDTGDQAAALDRHGDYYLTFVREQENRLCSRHQKEAMIDLADEIANIRLALESAIDSHQVPRLERLSFVLLYFYEIHGWYREGESIFRDAARKLQAFQETDPLLETGRRIALLELQTNQAYFTRRLGNPAEAYATHRRCTDLLRSLGDKDILRYSLRYGALAATRLGRLDEAALGLREDLELTRASDRPWDVGIVNAYLGYVARAQGALADAQDYYRQGLAISRRLGDPRLIAFNLSGLGFVLLSLDEPIQAREPLEEALALAHETGDRYDLGIALGLLGQVARSLGETAKARAYFEESIALLKEIGDAMNLPGAYVRLGHLALSMDDASEAEGLFRSAVNIAIQTQDVMSVLDALAGLAAVRALRGSGDSAMELVLFILRQPYVEVNVRKQAEELCAGLVAQLAPERIRAIELRVQASTLEKVTHEMLASPPPS